jgi:flagellar hook protein FlgE
MMRSLFSAVSGLKSNQTAMDVIGNNIANVNTIGFKGSRTIFQDIYSQTISSATAPTGDAGGMNAKQVGLGVTISTIGMNMTEGSTQSTSRPLDFAIAGEGFFVIQNSDGTYSYTRNGAFELDAEGYLVTANGNYVMAVSEIAADGTDENIYDGDDATIVDDETTILENFDFVAGETPMERIKLMGDVDTDGDGENDDFYSEYAVDSYGVITAVNNAGDIVKIGRIVTATFNNTGGLEKVGSSLYNSSSNSGEPNYNFVGVSRGTLASGSLEMSNVDLSTELTNMIITQRGFQANSRVVTTTDSMLEELINLKR